MGTGVSVLSDLKKGLQGWIRTASTRRTVRRGKKPLCNSDDRCQRQKQGGAVGAAASRMRVPPKARHSRWEPRPGLLILRGSRRPPAPTKKPQRIKIRCGFVLRCFALPSEQLGQNAVLNNKPGGGQGEGAAIEGGIPGTDAVLHKGQLRGGKLLAVQGFVGFEVKPLAQPQL